MKRRTRPKDYEQLSIFEEPGITCGDCWCRECLFWWSGRCPHGGCYDDLRAKYNPYNTAHPNEPPRTGWTDWRAEQAHWCRGGIFYPQRMCPNYEHYEGSKVKECLQANVQVFQDGYISCSLVDHIGCAECLKRFEEKTN